jgi:hypothetical protein
MTSNIWGLMLGQHLSLPELFQLLLAAVYSALVLCHSLPRRLFLPRQWCSPLYSCTALWFGWRWRSTWLSIYCLLCFIDCVIDILMIVCVVYSFTFSVCSIIQNKHCGLWFITYKMYVCMSDCFQKNNESRHQLFWCFFF